MIDIKHLQINIFKDFELYLRKTHFMVLDIFAFIVIIVLIAVVIWLVTLLGPMPGNIARQRKHPQTNVLRVLGRITLII